MAWLVYSHRGVAKRLVLDLEPAGAATAEPFATQPVGHLVDGSGLPSRTAGVTVTASKVTGSGTLGGTLTAVTDDEGIFAFSDLELDTVTTGVTLQFTAGALVAVTSAAFDVTAGSGTAYALTAEATSYAWSGAATTLRWGRCHPALGPAVDGGRDELCVDSGCGLHALGPADGGRSGRLGVERG